MTPRVGQLAPPFRARSDDGRLIDLAELRGRWVVLYFYPRAGTPGCSVEAQRFEEALPEFGRLGAEVIGVSTDTEAQQARFRDRCGLSFPLLPDGDRAVAEAYGVLGGVGKLLGMTARQTFLIDPAGRLAFHWKRVNPLGHAAEVLQTLAQCQRADPPAS